MFDLDKRLVELLDDSYSLMAKNREAIREAREHLHELREAEALGGTLAQGIRVTVEMDGVKHGFTYPGVPAKAIDSGHVAQMVRDTIDAFAHAKGDK